MAETITTILKALAEFGILPAVLIVVCILGVGVAHWRLKLHDAKIGILESSLVETNKHIANIDGKLDILIELNRK